MDWIGRQQRPRPSRLIEIQIRFLSGKERTRRENFRRKMSKGDAKDRRQECIDDNDDDGYGAAPIMVLPNGVPFRLSLK